MTLINASLLAGVLLAGLPVLLHMIMRAKPKKIEFPALRLLQSRQTSNSRRMRMRHILLLILRGIVIAVAVLALVRPSLPAARYGLRWYEWLLLGTVVIGAWSVYRWRLQKATREESAEHLLRERRGRLRVFALLGGILAALLAVGIPWGIRLKAEITSPRNPIAPDIPVAAVFVFDTSLSMTYKHESKTRLEHAIQVSLDHLKILPPRSRVAVATTSPDSEPVFQADLAGVRSRIEDLRHHAVPRSLNAVVKNAIEAHVTDREEVQQQLSTGDSFAREIYLLTDLSEAAWDQPDESGLRDLLTQYQWLQVYLIDVSVANPINMALSQLRLDREATTAGQPVNVSVAVSATAAADAAATVEVFRVGPEGEEVPGGGAGGSAQQRVKFEGAPPVATFFVSGDPGEGTQRGFIRLSTADPMPFDDIRYFTFGVSDVPKVLLVGDSELDTWFFRNALQPVVLDDLGIQRADCKSVTGAQFDRETLPNYDIICVMNWRQPTESAWPELLRYVSNGGALFVTAGGHGRHLETARWTTTDATDVLPGVPLVPLSFRPQPGRLNLIADDHPVVSSFLKNPEAKTEISRPIFDRSWTFNWHQDARVLMEFNDPTRRPALVERSVGQGRVLLFTSAIDNNGTDHWNEDFITNDPWAFLMLVDQLMSYLTGAADAKRNYTTGDPVEIAVPTSQRFSDYRVARPGFRQTRGTQPFEESSVLLTDIDEAGHYHLWTTDEGNSFSAEFAASDIDSESNLTPITDEDLMELFGEGRFSRVTDPEELDRAVSLGRLGVEVFPVLMGLLVLLFCSEHLMANFFYDEEPSTESK